MSVPAWKRSGSRLDVFFEAVKLRHIITQMIMRNFGMKTGKYKHLVTRKMRENYPDLKRAFDRIDDYQENVEATKELKQYEQWMLNKVRSNLFMYSSELVEKIAEDGTEKQNFTFDFMYWTWNGQQQSASVQTIGGNVNARYVYKLVGVKYEAVTASKDTELTDIRVSADGTVYTTAGAAVRALENRVNDQSIEISGTTLYLGGSST